jgi:CheY-like chemotaxis protein
MGAETPAGLTPLVVEDNGIDREGLAVVVRRAGGTVALAANGADALALLRGLLVADLIPLDMVMPVMDGWGFLMGRRRDPALTSVPVVIMTAFHVTGAEFVTAGAAGWLPKPVETEALLAEVRRCCRPRSV